MRRQMVVFDMDGTLLEENSWLKLHAAFGLTPMEDTIMLGWYQEGLISYHQWTSLIERIYLHRGLATRERALAAFLDCGLSDQAAGVVREVRERGYDLALLSGGIDILVARVAETLGILQYRANHALLFDEQGRLDRLETIGNDAEFKRTELARLCEDLHISPDDCYCVGDGCNDRLIFEMTGRGILICPDGVVPPIDCAWRRAQSLAEVTRLLP